MKRNFNGPEIRVEYFNIEILTASGAGTDGVDMQNKALAEKNIANVQEADLSSFILEY